MDKKHNDIMAKRVALQQLIAVDGDCTKLDAGFCKDCPLDTCKTRPDGSYMSCLAAVESAYGPEPFPEEGFLKLAMDLLGQLEVENMLRGPDVKEE